MLFIIIIKIVYFIILLYNKMNFPKNIFQTWKTKDVPDKWKDAQKSVIDMNPGWNYTLLTDDDNDRIVKENFPYFIKLLFL